MSEIQRILVVDDDRLMCEMLEVILTGAGYEVLLAEDGKAALELASSQHPDLVITDGLLPKLHGFKVCKAIKGLGNPPKVVLLTGIYTKPNYKYEVMREYGADAVLIKPVNLTDLLSCIEKQLAPAPPPTGRSISAVNYPADRLVERSHSVGQ